jgi:hypothetical protein
VLWGLVAIVTVEVILAAYLKCLVSILQATASLGIFLQMMFVDLCVIVLIVLVFRLRAKARKTGHTLAQQIGRIGLRSGGKSVPGSRMAALATMGTLASTASNLMARRKRAVPPANNFIDNRSVTLVNNAPIPRPRQLPPTAPPAAQPAPATPSSPATPAQPAALPASKPARAQRAAQTTMTAVRIAKAAPGGVGGVAAATAKEVGRSAARKALPGGKQAPAPRPGQLAAPARPQGRRIVVDAAGTAHVNRQQAAPTQQPPTAPRPSGGQRSLRSAQLRRELTAAKGA